MWIDVWIVCRVSGGGKCSPCPALPAGSRVCIPSQPVTAGRTRIPRGGVCSAVRARSEIKICTSSLRVWQVLVYVRDARIGGHFPTLSLLQRRATRWIGRFSRAATSGIGLAAKWLHAPPLPLTLASCCCRERGRGGLSPPRVSYLLGRLETHIHPISTAAALEQNRPLASASPNQAGDPPRNPFRC